MNVSNCSRLIVAGITLSIALTSYSQDVNNLKLKDYRPVSIYKSPKTEDSKSKISRYRRALT